MTRKQEYLFNVQCWEVSKYVFSSRYQQIIILKTRQFVVHMLFVLKLKILYFWVHKYFVDQLYIQVLLLKLYMTQCRHKSQVYIVGNYSVFIESERNLSVYLTQDKKKLIYL